MASASSSTASVDALYAMMKRKQAEAADSSQSRKSKRKDDTSTSNSSTSQHPSKKRKPSLTTADTKKSSTSITSSSASSSSRASLTDKDRPKLALTAAQLVAQRTIRPSATPPPGSSSNSSGGSSELPASSLAAQLVLSSSLAAGSSSSQQSSAFSPRSFSRPRWSHEPVSRRNVSGNLVVWPLWVAAHSKAQQLVSQGAAVRSKAAAAGSKARAQSRRDEVVYSSDDGDDDSDVSDAEADLPDDDTPAHPIRTSAFHLPPVTFPQSLLLSMRPDKRDAEIEKMELKLLSKKSVIERDTRRPYVDMEGGSRHMLPEDPLDKPTSQRQSSTNTLGSIGSSAGSSSSNSFRSVSPSPHTTSSATGSSPSATHTPASTGIPIPFTKHNSTFICGICNKTFPDLSKLRRHSNVHVEGDRRRLDDKGGVREARYVCLWPECGKSFLHLNSLRFHERSHKPLAGQQQPAVAAAAAAQPPQHPQQPQQVQQQHQGGKEEKDVKRASTAVKAEPGVKAEVKRESSG